MAWETRNGRKYFYRSVHRAGKVTKHYFGTGLIGTIAANTMARHSAERRAAHKAWKQQEEQLDGADRLTRAMYDWGQLVIDAALYASGFHRPCRHGWREWRRGRSALKHYGTTHQ